MNWLRKAKKTISTAMTFILVGGLLLTAGVEEATAQGSFESSNDQNMTIDNTTQLNPIPSMAIGSTEQETKASQDPLSFQKNDSITPSIDELKAIQTGSPHEELTTVIDRVYFPEDGSKSSALNLLAQVEQLSKKKAQLPNVNAIREIPEKRTPNSKHYLMKDGTYQAVLSLHDQHYQDAAGNFQDIVPFLIENSETSLFNGTFSKEYQADSTLLGIDKKATKENEFYKAPQVPFDVKIPKNFRDGYSIQKGNTKLDFIPQNAASVIGAVYGINGILYKNVWNQVDAILEVTQQGIKESLVLKDSSAPTDFYFAVNGLPNETGDTKDLIIAPLWLIDAKGEYRTVEHKFSKKNNQDIIELQVNTEGLQYPIIVDPSVSIKYATQDTFVASNAIGMNAGNDLLLHAGSNGESHRWALIQFDISNVPSNAFITNATVELTQYYSEIGKKGDLFRFFVSPISSAWNEMSVTYPSPYTNTFPTYDYRSQIQCDDIKDDTNKRKLDITVFAKQWHSGTRENYGILIQRVDFSEQNFFKFTYPTLVVNYDLPSSGLQIINPNGGETVDSIYSINWRGAIDPDDVQSNLTYQVQLSSDNGVTWKDILVLSNPGQTSFTYDFKNEPATTTARIQVRAYDGILYSPWDQSDAPFTIQHNRAPNAPTGLTPGYTSSSAPTLVSGVTPTLNWTFSDPDAGDTQSAYNVLIYNSSNGLVYDSGWVTSSAKSYSVPNNKLVRGTAYSWKVLVKDSKGAVSPASASMYIKTNALPTLTLTSYADGDTLTINAPTLTWTFKDADGQTQAAFQVQGSKDNFATIAYNSGTINKADTSHTTTQLSSGIWSFRVMVWDGVEWSAYATRKLELPNNYEPNDSFTTAASIQSADTILSEIGTAGDVDFYKFTTGSAGYYKVTLSSPANLNYDVYVYDANQNLIDAGVQGANVTDNLMFAVNESSVYYIKVIGLNNAYSATAKYGLRVLLLQLSAQTNYAYDNNGNLQSKATTFSEAFSGQSAKYTTYDGTVKTAVNAPNVNVTAGGKNTVEFWMKWDGTNDRMPFSWGTGYDLWIINNSFGFNTGEGNVLGIDASPLKGQWVHVAAVFYNGVPNSSNCELYINGKKQVLSQRVGQTTLNRTGSTQAYIAGWNWDEDHKFSGSIGGLHIWNRALSGYEIQNNLYRVYLGDESGLVYSQP